MFYKNFLKRIIDILGALVALVLFSPIFLVVLLILFIQNRGSIFFYQERPGLMQKPFHIIKFKTMSDRKDSQGKLLPDVQRITKAGDFIRKLSLDELPQLINILKGDMSLVGPRPLLFKYIPLYSPEQLRRHSVRPGVTGWAQVNGRNSISWTRKFELDIEYINNISFLMDIKILLLTFYKVFKKEGVNQSEDRPMEPFNGYN
ncbi:sugar transferase [Mongoliitalea daihaiensis]|uniref:sugar transferase n=1 Tax=Mongoliitalea daihaiensis TaxID=2782006 RepID=UPI001F350D32|nr:sugar transferase [Mongoliitalea daihaiensis]UJP64453.1 sugar transferase [Mongoliitalea daihaiensis]